MPSGSISSNTTSRDGKNDVPEFVVEGPLLRPPTHPGELLRVDVLPALDLSVSAAARRLGVTRQTLHRILAGTHPVTPMMAARLGRLCGNGAELWLGMQAARDLWHIERDHGAELDRIGGG